MPKHLKKGGVKGSKGSMKMEDGSVHHNKYDGCYTKQWVWISKAIWISPILKITTSWTFSNKTSLMKNDVKDEVLNENPNILNPFDGVFNKDGVSKLNDKLKGDHVAHF